MEIMIKRLVLFILDQELHDKLKAEFERDFKPYLPTLADFVRQQKMN